MPEGSTGVPSRAAMGSLLCLFIITENKAQLGVWCLFRVYVYFIVCFSCMISLVEEVSSTIRKLDAHETGDKLGKGPLLRERVL